MKYRRIVLRTLTSQAALPLALLVFHGCASAPPKENTAEAEIQASRQEEMRKQLEELGQKIEAIAGKFETMENRVVGMNEKVDATRSSLDSLMNVKRPSTVSVPENIPNARGVPVDAGIAAHTSTNDPDFGYVNDAAIKAYRQAYVFYRAGKFSEAILAFSTFVERFPDHAMAGAAQYYVGMCYMKQQEFQLASNELQRVITSYDRSSHVTQTLKELANAEENLKKPEDAQKWRSQLVSLFPNSPASKDFTSTAGALDAAAGTTPPPTAPATPLETPSAVSASAAPPATETAAAPTVPADASIQPSTPPEEVAP